MRKPTMSKKYLSIELTEDEKNKAIEWITALNTAMNIITSPLPITYDEEKVRDFYKNICQSFGEGKVLEHLWRCEISKKYNVDYAVGFDSGVLYYEED